MKATKRTPYPAHPLLGEARLALYQDRLVEWATAHLPCPRPMNDFERDENVYAQNQARYFPTEYLRNLARWAPTPAVAP